MVGAREGPVASLADVRPVPCVPPVVPLQFVAASELPAAGVPVADVRLLACGMKSRKSYLKMKGFRSWVKLKFKFNFH